ncbi:hypothetical protein Ga0074812_103267 [Parafrankia irregularis]|uniref:Uncharacterized protein n=1 Tax=Parafrankia irregularis TaxID=795642 RepID=A0A0S4QHP3_9ACTN|nr:MULTISPECIES: hypothetical protein [Parafrankia]MBE3200830.1 hypothetical protein [Parafrankia sp. CH37]CUU54777.1 hypothetical protein Ga0074812_103267 [Parafrankia irregularis]
MNTATELVRLLFIPRERWGWEFVPPAPPAPAPELHRPPIWQPPSPPDVSDLQRTQEQTSFGPWMLIGGLFGLWSLAGFYERDQAPAVLLLTIGVFIASIPFIRVSILHRRVIDANAQASAEFMHYERSYQVLTVQWRQRLYAHDQAEAERIERATLYFPLDAVGAPRIDVLGGTTAGWSSLLATCGASLLGSGRGILLIDLTERGVADELVSLAGHAGVPADVHELPAALEQVGTLDGLDANEVADLIADAIDAERRDGGEPTLRVIDADILRTVTTRLAPPFSFARLAAALRVLDNHEDALHTGLLATAEIAALQQRMHGLAQRDRVADQIRFLRTELDHFAEQPTPGPAPRRPAGDPGWWPDRHLRVLATSSRGVSARHKSLVDRIVVQAVLARMRQRSSMTSRPVLVVAGADRVGRTALDALVRHAELTQVRLVLMFERLADDAERLLGTHGGAAVIMRLGNAREAGVAADFIGRGYRFTLSQLTEQIGRSLADGVSSSHGEQVGESVSEGRSSGYGLHSTDSRNSSVSSSFSETWQRTRSFTETTSRNDGSTYQRVHEYTVEPTVLQSLPATAFVLVGTVDGPGRVRSGDCNPGTVLLPKVADVNRVPEGAPGPAVPGHGGPGRAYPPPHAYPLPSAQPAWQGQPPGYAG